MAKIDGVQKTFIIDAESNGTLQELDEYITEEVAGNFNASVDDDLL